MIILLAVLALAAADPPADAPAPLADLQQVYDQSCAAREFGAYDDMCDQLRKQIRQAQIDEARQARLKRDARPRAPAKPASAGQAAADPPTPH